MSLNNIKSSFFIKKLSYHLNEKIKLKIIQHNKKYQDLSKINLINYKLFSGRFINYESNGKVKKFSFPNNDLMFEGEYKNGKRNGKRIEYSKKGKIKYEGEYLNGKRNGKGKKYYNDSLIFEGDYLKWKKWSGIVCDKEENKYELKNGKGFIKEYIEEQSLLFEGEYLNGEKNWKGILSSEYGVYLDGEFYKGRRWKGKSMLIVMWCVK